jgi:molybdenum cofactor biosynthesis enzyme MoaA
MTGYSDADTPRIERQDRSIHIACSLAYRAGVSTVLLTGKGEPTLHPDRLSRVMGLVRPYDFPFMELQTNGVEIECQRERWIDTYLKQWYDLRLTTICLSVVHYDSEKNKELIRPAGDVPLSLLMLLYVLHDAGFTVRLCCIMVKDYIDTYESVRELIAFAKKHDVEQLTIRPVTAPDVCANKAMKQWVEQNRVPNDNLQMVVRNIGTNAVKLLEIPEVGTVYDFDGQNICVATCLTTPHDDEVRQIIVMPNGSIRYDWQHRGAVLPH